MINVLTWNVWPAFVWKMLTNIHLFAVHGLNLWSFVWYECDADNPMSMGVYRKYYHKAELFDFSSVYLRFLGPIYLLLNPDWPITLCVVISLDGCP